MRTGFYAGRWGAMAAVLGGLLLVSPALRAAPPVEDRFAGEIVVLRKRAPARFRNQAAFADFLRQYRSKRLVADRSNAKRWTIEFMAFFKRPVDDFEVKVKFFDITKGRVFVAGDSILTSARGQRILATSMALEGPTFAAKRRYQMYLVDARGVALASAQFELDGETERYSGHVEFSDADAAQ
ncbi:MAG: hypothetical protein IPG96_14720 [Proteobacteria bacterium]|nr:hypothetical protein [Pseudomonadota bacterium]